MFFRDRQLYHSTHQTLMGRYQTQRAYLCRQTKHLTATIFIDRHTLDNYELKFYLFPFREIVYVLSIPPPCVSQQYLPDLGYEQTIQSVSDMSFSMIPSRCSLRQGQAAPSMFITWTFLSGHSLFIIPCKLNREILSLLIKLIQYYLNHMGNEIDRNLEWIYGVHNQLIHPE